MKYVKCISKDYRFVTIGNIYKVKDETSVSIRVIENNIDATYPKSVFKEVQHVVKCLYNNYDERLTVGNLYEVVLEDTNTNIMFIVLEDGKAIGVSTDSMEYVYTSPKTDDVIEVDYEDNIPIIINVTVKSENVISTLNITYTKQSDIKNVNGVIANFLNNLPQ